MTTPPIPASPSSAEERPYFRMPAISPDGETIVFCYASDIWLVSIMGGAAERLTAHPANHSYPRFSHDGSCMAVTSNRAGTGDLYIIPMTHSDGGTSHAIRRVTHHDEYATMQDWSPDGQQLYFTSERAQQGDAIYGVSVTGGTPYLIHTEPYQTIDHVAISPDGHTLAFNITHSAWWRRGPNPFAPCPIWLLDMRHDGWEAALRNQHRPIRERLPSGSHDEANAPHLSRLIASETTMMQRWPLWAPDGRGLYFVSDRDGTENIWFHPTTDPMASPTKITHFTSGRLLWPAISRTGSGVLVFEHMWQLWRLDLATNESAPIPITIRPDTKITPTYTESRTRYASQLSLSPDGKKIAFVARGEIFADFADKETEKEQRDGPSYRVTRTHAREQHPVWTADSRSLIYLSDRHGENDLYRYDFPTRQETRLTHDPTPKWSPCCSPDGQWVAYIHGMDTIRLFPLATGEERHFATGNFMRNHSLAWSPDSNWLAFLSHDSRFFCNVSVQHIDETTAHQITFLSNITGHTLLWSPDGSYLIFTSAHYRRESQIVRVDLRPIIPFLREDAFEKLFEEEKKGDKTPKEPPKADNPPDTPEEDEEEDDGKGAADPERESESPPSPEPSPDGETPEPDDDSPAESEQQTETPSSKMKPIDIVFEGIERRLRILTPIQMDASAACISPNSRDLLFLANVAGKWNIWSLPMDEPRLDSAPVQITANSRSKYDVQFSPDGKRFFYVEDGQITSRKFPNGTEPSVVPIRADVEVDFHQEKVHVFDEAWRMLRDTFYDPTFHGIDWESLRAEMKPLIGGAQTSTDILVLFNLMVGELRTSHMGAFWDSSWRNRDGYTGLLFDPVTQLREQRLQISAIVPETPAALVANPPQPGEYLMAVDDTPITPETNLDMLLHRTIGRRVRLRLAPSPDGAWREVAIRPIDSERYERIIYRMWVAENEAYVHHISNGRLGYIHIEEMSYAAYQQFLVDVDTETYNREGVVLDVRFNRGGHMSTFLLDVLTRRSVLFSGFRQQLSADTYHLAGNRSLNKPTVLLTNERTASDAEIFTEIYSRLELGKVVGKPTAGGVIWTTSHYLLNGMALRLPMYSVSTPEGEMLEGTGRPVDVEVEQPLGAWAMGRDRQLDAAVALLLNTLPVPDRATI